MDRWMELMRTGDFEGAWQHNDVLRCEQKQWFGKDVPRHLQMVWDGSPLDRRRVLICCYHGLGDTIQFIRYTAQLAELGSTVIVWAQPELLLLLSSVPSIHHLIPLNDHDAGVDADVTIEVMELPYAFRSLAHTVPSRVPYLHAEPLPWRTSDRLRVGLVWAPGNPDSRRIMPFDAVAPLFDLPNVEMHVLQRGGALAECAPGLGVRSGSDDVAQTARVMKTLDLIVTVDSMPAHLAGALARPVWLLLHHEADWRWMRDRADSPWYPTLRLLRQPRPGDWHAVAAAVAEELKSSRRC